MQNEKKDKKDLQQAEMSDLSLDKVIGGVSIPKPDQEPEGKQRDEAPKYPPFR